MIESFLKKLKDKPEKFIDWLSFRFVLVLAVGCLGFIHKLIPSLKEFYKTGELQIFLRLVVKNQDNIIKALKIGGLYLCLACVIYGTYIVFKQAWLSRKAGLKNFYFGKNILKILGKKIAKANHISILLITGHDSFGTENDSAVKQALSGFSGAGEARVLIMEAGCPELEQRARDVRKKDKSAEKEIEHYNKQAEENKKFLQKLRDEEKRDVDFGTYSERPIWKMFIIDNELYLQAYPIRKHSDFAPIFHFSKGKNRSLYSNFCKVFQKKWKNRKQYMPEEGIS